ncbi:MAG: carboxylating nicotinate-nucleotide diphosphorylase [Planctomycetes bacterium]|nr:carboxylating nicotinate-nucleotide diphosphorylase [Planctomycetota bacterium]
MTRKEFRQVTWDEETVDDCRQLVRLAVREDLGRGYDLTTVALVPHDSRGEARIVCRESGVIAGLPAAKCVLQEMNADVQWQPSVEDAARVAPGTTVATLAGSTRDLLTVERPVLNFLGKLSGIATLTRRYVDLVADTQVRIYDTRKTTPGWRRLEKYAVGCGGGTNHRTGLFDAILIKDNHLAQGRWNPAEAIRSSRSFLIDQNDATATLAEALVEIEVDTLDQLGGALQAAPDIVLLDNMSCDELRQAVRRRDAAGVLTELEASGGVNLETVRDIAETGVERISVGALTHSAIGLDLGLDWSC